MGNIRINTNQKQYMTLIPDIFIDRYMPGASGVCIKVYIYLLRCMSAGADISLQIIAERIDESEKDVVRALNYWHDLGVIEISTDTDGSIAAITLSTLDISNDTYNTPAEAAVHDTPSDSSALISATDEESATVTDVIPVEAPLKPDYTDSQLAILAENNDIRFIISAAEKYLMRMLSTDDQKLLIYLYESLEFSTDLIIHLLEYCASRNKKTTGYIEKVALNWHKNGIDTVEKAETESSNYSSHYNVVNKAFGLNRTPGEAERNFVDIWFNTYSFTPDIVSEACARALLATGKPDFKYTNSILERWHKQGVCSMNDVRKLDDIHAAKSAAQAARNAAKPTVNNRFNAFPQRSYSGSDFDMIEQHALNRGK